MIIQVSSPDYFSLRPLPPFRFFLCRLWIQQAITRILISTTTVPSEMPINIKRPLDVFINGLPVVSVCCVVRIDKDCCGATELLKNLLFLCVFGLFIHFCRVVFLWFSIHKLFLKHESNVRAKTKFMWKICVYGLSRPWIIWIILMFFLIHSLVRYAQSKIQNPNF